MGGHSVRRGRGGVGGEGCGWAAVSSLSDGTLVSGDVVSVEMVEVEMEVVVEEEEEEEEEEEGRGGGRGEGMTKAVIASFSFSTTLSCGHFSY